MANPGTSLTPLPRAVAISPLDRMMVAVDIDGIPRRFYGIQRPQPSDPATQTENYEYSEGQVPTGVTETPGNVTLEFTHVANGLVDKFLSKSKEDNATITMRVFTRGKLLYTPPAAARLSYADAGTSQDVEKGLSLITTTGLAAGVDGATTEPNAIKALVNGGQIREGCVVQLVKAPAEESDGTKKALMESHDLMVIESPFPAADGSFKLYTAGRGSLAAIADADSGAFEFYDSSTEWVVSGTLVSYGPQYGQAARTARLEMTRTVETDKQIRYEDAHKNFVQAA